MSSYENIGKCLDQLINIDIIERGIIDKLYIAAYEKTGEYLIYKAAKELISVVANNDVVFIVTGFRTPPLYIQETDGPLGAASIARAIDVSLGAKPVIITETGCPTHIKPEKQGKIIENQLKIIGENIAGVCIFEWTDEWWKGGNKNMQDFHIEDHWGILTAFRQRKSGYQIIKKYFNSIETQSYGFNADLFR